MNRLLASSLIGAMAVVTLMPVRSSATDTPAPDRAAVDLILTHAHIKTPTGWAEALAVRGGVIVAVGDCEVHR